MKLVSFYSQTNFYNDKSLSALMKKLYIFLTIALALNIIWEFSHYFLYFDLTEIPKNLHLLSASLTDVLLIFILFLSVSSINKNFSWINKPKIKDYFFLIVFGLIIAFLLEVINLNLGRWAYTDAMPTIFSIGLSPLLQLATTSAIALKLSNL